MTGAAPALVTSDSLGTPNRVKRRRVRGERAADHVFRSIAGRILSRELAPGSVLPAEREIARTFEVSGPIARQALYQLDELGLVAINQGKPSVVLDPDEAADLRIVALSYELATRGERELHDLAERIILHVGNLLDLAEGRISKERLGGLQKMLDDYAATGPDEDLFPELERDFWLEMARGAGNSIFLRETRWWFAFAETNGFDLDKDMSPRHVRFVLYNNILDYLRREAGAAQLYRQVARTGLNSRAWRESLAQTR